MKKLLLVSTAIAGVAFMASPASAALKMDLGGYFQGYGVYSDNNEAAGAANSLHSFDFRRDNEIHVNGETTLDNGLTIGAHTELKIANSAYTSTISGTAANSGSNGANLTFAQIAAGLSATTSANSTNLVDETYLYASGGWGRVNFGEEDGAAYLLQVAAPSADSNVDGMRVYIQALNTALWDTSLSGTVLSYQHADFRQVDRLTYLTPKFNGFQAGVSYAPQNNASVVGGGTAAQTNDSLTAGFDNLWEASARWDGEFQGVAISAGGGYSTASNMTNAAATVVGSDDLVTWNGGLNVAISGFSLGGAYKHSNNGIQNDSDSRTWVVGGAYDNGPYHAGVSYLNTKFQDGLLAGNGGDATVTRYAVGGGYTFGPGMTFRGSVDWGKFDARGAQTDTDHKFTQVTVGTDVQF